MRCLKRANSIYISDVQRLGMKGQNNVYSFVLHTSTFTFWSYPVCQTHTTLLALASWNVTGWTIGWKNENSLNYDSVTTVVCVRVCVCACLSVCLSVCVTGSSQQGGMRSDSHRWQRDNGFYQYTSAPGQVRRTQTSRRMFCLFPPPLSATVDTFKTSASAERQREKLKHTEDSDEQEQPRPPRKGG